MQRALLHRFVKRGYGLAIGLLRGLFVALSNGFTQCSQDGPQAGTVGAIGGSAPFGLPGAFKRREMIRHV